MSSDPSIREEAFPYFVNEASDLLQEIEHDLLTLREDRTSAKVHSLMRSAHTLKGAAATVGLETIQHVAHVLEDVFRALYNPDIEIDDDVEALLFEGYDCLRKPLMAEINGSAVDESDILNRAAAIISRLQDKLGDLFDRETPIPTAQELGFDVVKSMFEAGVEQRLTNLHAAIQAGEADLAAQGQVMCEIFLGLAESLQLPGFGAIATATLAGLSAHPQLSLEIVTAAYEDFRVGQRLVLGGDRTQGGNPSAQLLELARGQGQAAAVPFPSDDDATAALDALGAGLENLFSGLPILAMPEEPFPHGDQIGGLFGEPVMEPITQSLETEEHGALAGLESLFGGMTLESIAEPMAPEIFAIDETAIGAEIENAEIENAEIADVADFNAVTSMAPIEALANAPLDDLPSNSLDQLFGGLGLNGATLERESLSTEEAIAPPETPPATAPTPIAPAQPSRKAATPITATGIVANRPKESQVNVRVGLEQVLRLDHLVGELLTNQIQTTEEDEQLGLGIRELLSQLRLHRRTLSDLQSAAQQMGLDEWDIDHQPLQTTQVAPKISAAVSIPQLPLSAQFDALEMDRYSDLHIFTQKALNEAVQLEIVIEAIDQQTRSTRRTRDARQRLFCQLRDDLAAIRLKPIGELFNRFPRVLQQLSTTYNKKVSLSLIGSHVLIDKVTLDSLYDSLLHLVRNGFDHGIETHEQRQAAGKPAEGKIELRAYQQGNRTLIEVRDDGQGVNLERIAAKAIEQGLIKVTETEEISEAEILDFLFHPGFSTASKLSELSGRGVGLDVVRSQIEKLDGEILIRSEPGKGTTFILSMPLSVTITKQLICKSSGSTYAIAADTIDQVLLPRPQQLRDLGDPSELGEANRRWVLELRQGDTTTPVPVQPLTHLIHYAHGTPGTPSSSDISAKPILLIACPDGLRGIQVDQVIGEQEVSIRALGSAIAPPRYIQGCTILGDSHLALAIEPNVLLAHSREGTQARNMAIRLQQRPTAQATRLLIIDDSLTQRRTLERSLQVAGYEITQAEDGLDALVNLQQNPEISLIICDLEMPRMNGFEFISQTRTLPGLCDIPIVILTSRSGSKYQQLALELGAAAFLSKPYTDYELLNTVSTLLQKSQKLEPTKPELTKV